MAEKKLSEKEMRDVKGGANLAKESVSSVVADESATAIPTVGQPINVTKSPVAPPKPV
jgi:hypothetical protein